MDGLLEAALPVIGRAIVYICIELIAYIVFYYTGFVFFKVASLGRYPKNSRLNLINSKRATPMILSGLVFWVVGLISLVAINWG